VKKYEWMTDVHLDHLERSGGIDHVKNDFVRQIGKDVDGIMITGDISLGSDIVRHLEIIDSIVDKPVYFVLGNHDFYKGSFQDTRQAVIDCATSSKNLNYMTSKSFISLTNDTAIVGHDGWYDGYHGDAISSPYIMSDWLQIAEYINEGALHKFPSQIPTQFYVRPNFGIILGISRQQAMNAAQHVLDSATLAAKTHKSVFIMTHVPPFLDLYIRKPTDGEVSAAPWYTSKFMGEAIIEIANLHPDVRFDVFCGHTHQKKDVQISNNVFGHVGPSAYGSPQCAGIIIAN